MACCFICVSDDELDGDKDKYGKFTNYFQVGIKDACCKDCGCCIVSTVFFPCALYKIRESALNGNFKEYSCCQGYYHACTKCIDGQEENCPECCLMMEATCCCSCSISATRMLVMDQYLLHSDPWDRRLIRVNNMLQCLSIICDIAALVDDSARDCADLLDCISQVFYCSLQSCMVTQVHLELKYQRGEMEKSGTDGPAFYRAVPSDETPVARPVNSEEMDRETGGGPTTTESDGDNSLGKYENSDNSPDSDSPEKRT